MNRILCLVILLAFGLNLSSQAQSSNDGIVGYNPKLLTSWVVTTNDLVPQNDENKIYNPTQPENTPKVTDNDSLSGESVKPGENVRITNIPTSAESPVSIEADGSIVVKAETPTGDYPFSYEICLIDASPSNCKIVTGNVIVVNELIPENDVDIPYNPTSAEDSPLVTANDQVGGQPVRPVDGDNGPANVQITGVAVEGSPVTIEPDGSITVKPGTPTGDYPFSYKICEIGASRTNVSSGFTTASVLNNDKLNGESVKRDDVVLTHGELPAEGIRMNDDGTITVAAGTKAGDYVMTYRICELVNPNNCDDATVKIKVVASGSNGDTSNCKTVTGNLIVTNDLEPEHDYNTPYNPTKPTETPKVSDNDKLAGQPVKPGENVTITDLPTSSDSPIKIEKDGSIRVESGTATGEYLFSYEICEIGASPVNCRTVYGTIQVENSISALDDLYSLEWTREIRVTGSVIENDTFNDAPVDLSMVTLTAGIPSNISLTMNEDGTINIPAATRPGNYEFPYTICETSNLDNCTEAVAYIEIRASELFIPNVFTPNGDGLNDTFEIIGLENFDKAKLIIINRWGNEVYRSDNYKNDWTGHELNEGTYYYILTVDKGSDSTNIKGWILIKTR